jgi:hypothetical protein
MLMWPWFVIRVATRLDKTVAIARLWYLAAKSSSSYIRCKGMSLSGRQNKTRESMQLYWGPKDYACMMGACHIPNFGALVCGPVRHEREAVVGERARVHAVDLLKVRLELVRAVPNHELQEFRQ